MKSPHALTKIWIKSPMRRVLLILPRSMKEIVLAPSMRWLR